MSKLNEIIEKPLSGEWGEEDEVGTGIPVLRTTNFTNEGVVNYSNVVTRKIDPRKAKEKYLVKGDIIIEKSGGSPAQPVGRVVFFEGEDNKYLFNNFTSVLRVKDKNDNFPKYVFYSLHAGYKQGKTKRFQNKTTGISNLKLDKFIKETEIYLPPFETQKQIAKTLDTVVELLAMRKQQLAELDNLIKAVFYEMFGDPVVNEKGWKTKKLGHECEIITGNTPSRKDKQNYGDYIEWIKSDNINAGEMYLSKAKECLSEKGFSVSRFVEFPSILMTCIAGSIKSIGNVGIANRKVAFNQQINAIVPNDNNVFFLYTLFLFTKEYIQSSINMSLKGILSKGKLADLEFIFPPIELQNHFATILTKIEAQKSLVKKAIEETQYLFDSLMAQYFE